MEAAKQTITFRTMAETRDQLDNAADAMNQIYSSQVAHIEEGRKQVRKGDFVPEQEWRLAFNR